MEDLLLEYLNDKIPAFITDDLNFLQSLGVVKHDGICKRIKQRDENIEITIIELSCFLDLSFEEWDEDREDGDG